MATSFTKKYPEFIELQGNKFKIVIDEGGKEQIQEHINNHIYNICAYNTLQDWKVSCASIKYLNINTMDTVGRIVSIDYNTRDVEIELMEQCDDPNSYRYIDPKDYDKYDLKIRGLCSRVAGEPITDGDTLPLKIITFDLIKRD